MVAGGRVVLKDSDATTGGLTMQDPDRGHPNMGSVRAPHSTRAFSNSPNFASEKPQVKGMGSAEHLVGDVLMRTQKQCTVYYNPKIGVIL